MNGDIPESVVWAETIVLLAGTMLLVARLIRTLRDGKVDEARRFPPPPPNDSQPLDVWLALIVYLLVPGAVNRAIGIFVPEAIPASQPDRDALMSTAQIVSMSVALGCMTVLLLLIGRRPFHSLTAWGLSAADLPRRAGQALLLYLMIWPACWLLLLVSSELLPLLFPQIDLRQHDTIRNLTSPESSVLARTLLVTNAMFLAAMTEELFFRGILVPFLRANGGPWSAIVISGAAFGFFHYPLWHFMAPLTLFGMILAYLYLRHQSLTLVILIHLIFNSKTLLWIAISAAG